MAEAVTPKGVEQPFEKVDPQADFPALEREILAFWADNGIFEKRRALNAGKKKWSFLDGPITANNPMGVHHAWNRTYKDVFNRYFAMTGHELRYQQGFDCQGLWVEVEVEKELGLGSKRDIECLVPGDPVASIAKFVQLCKDRVNKFARVQTEQSVRLGYWMDWDRTDVDWAKPVDERKSYFTMSEENNYTIWAFLKKCFDKGMVYRGYDAMPWCGRCGVGLSEMEVKEGYKTIEHRAVFVRFALKDKPNEYLLVWTTTPWTMSSNVGAAVNPELTYIKVKLKGDVYYVAKGAFKLNRMESGGESEPEASVTDGPATGGKKSKREWLDGVPHLKSLEQLFKEKAGKEVYEIVGEVKGADMLGWAYTAPFDDLEAQNCECGYPDLVAKVAEARKWTPRVTARAVHKVIAWKDVGETEGTGIVHIAPGCGQADFELGKENGLPPVAPLDDAGCFHAGFGPLAGLNAVDPKTADAVFDLLKQRDALFATERYVHRYPHCWRCKTELLFRLVDEWFINMGPRNTEEGFRGDIMKVVKQVQFLPESINGQAREYDWLWNMGDWMISKKRFWGLALPIWVDEITGDFEVIGSREELKSRAVEGWSEFEGNSPHRPFVDGVAIRNPKTGNLMRRVPDVGNPWLDAGIVAFSTMKYNTDRAYWREWYPADFITESFPGQFRNWFYALLALSTMMGDGEPPFKTLLGFGTVLDQFGKAMHKTDGNSLEFNSAAGDANEGYELFCDIEPKETTANALKLLPKGHTATREVMTDIKGVPAKRVFAKYKPISADVIRWQFCRANPALNLKFGPEPADEVRSKFIFKLWNTYAFFCNCAAGDGFDPAMPPVLPEQRPEIDQWILLRLYDLSSESEWAFTHYDVMRFALAAERFIDDDLSNWYVRRVKPRLNSKVADLDALGLQEKWAAYQTLYTVLTTACRLLAPCVPFITEVMWRNLMPSASGRESVHLENCLAPTGSRRQDGRSESDDWLGVVILASSENTKYQNTDGYPGLRTRMNAVREVITLGGAARNVAKLNVRQPLAELRVRSSDTGIRDAVEALEELIRDELNVVTVMLLPEDAPATLRTVAKLNKKTAAAKLGSDFPDVEAAVRLGDPLTRMLTPTEDGNFLLGGHVLLPSDLIFEYIAEDGWAGAKGKNVEVTVSTVITEELKLAGLARNVIRLVNQARKDAKLDIADAITLHLSSTAEQLTKAIAAHRDNIAAEVQATAWSVTPPGGHTSEANVEGMPLVISFVKKD